jgi:hypothetical protein
MSMLIEVTFSNNTTLGGEYDLKDEHDFVNDLLSLLDKHKREDK